MLTDYHVHLRPDGPDTSPAEYFTAANAEAYRAAADARGIAELGVSEHIYRFTDALKIWDNGLWREFAHDDVDAYCAFVREETDLRLGIEADYIPGREDRVEAFLAAREWDYVVGSIHFVGEAYKHLKPIAAFGAGIGVGLLLATTMNSRSRTQRIAPPVIRALSEIAGELFR